MDHVVCLDDKFQELENLIDRNKSMIIRSAAGRNIPYGTVNEGDNLYFINKNSDGKVKACGVVTSVFCSDILSVEESFETIIRNQDKLQLPDKQFEQIAGNKCLVLIGIGNVKEVEPFCIDRSYLIKMDDWLTIGNIEAGKCRMMLDGL